MLFLTRVRKFGMVLIMAAIIGIIMCLMGMGMLALITAPVSGLLA